MDELNELPKRIRDALDARDARAARAAAGLDAERIAVRVLERLRSEPAELPARRWTRAAIRVAAALAVLVAGVVVARQQIQRPGSERALVVGALDALDALNAQQAESVLAAVEQLRAVDTTALATATASLTVDDLTEAELRALLQAMQSETEESR